MSKNDRLLAAMFIAGICCFLSAALSVASDSESFAELHITVYANERQERVFCQGQPIEVSVTLRRRDRDGGEMRVLRVGDKNLPWGRSLFFNIYKLGDGGGASTESTSSRSSPVKGVEVELMPGGDSYGGYVLGTNQFKDTELSARCAISPTNTSKLPPGKYAIQASFDTTDKESAFPDILHIRVLSREVPFVVVERPSDGCLDGEILRAKAHYCGSNLKRDEEIAVLEQAMQKEPARQDLRSRIGDAYVLKRDFKAAIREYRLYVEWVRQQPNIGKTFRDHADRVSDRIQRLEARVQSQVPEKQ